MEGRGPGRGVLLGVLAALAREKCWRTARDAGEATPDGMQHLLARAVWDTDGVAEDLRDYVVDHLGDPGAFAADRGAHPRDPAGAGRSGGTPGSSWPRWPPT